MPAMKIMNTLAKIHLKDSIFSRPLKLGSFLMAISCLTLSTGCTTWLKPVDSGEIVTPNVLITAENSSFSLRSGEKFRPPFQSHFLYGGALQGIVGKWKQALEDGARRVRVQCGNDHFYGILALNAQWSDETVYDYKIEVPDQYIATAKNGGRSVVYGLIPLTTVDRKEINWILWLSDEPFR
jgi:hypothetical protein